jgi:hypothetical protein
MKHKMASDPKQLGTISKSALEALAMDYWEEVWETIGTILKSERLECLKDLLKALVVASYVSGSSDMYEAIREAVVLKSKQNGKVQ